MTRILLVGITQDFMLTKKKHAEMLEPYSKRVFNVEDFLSKFDKNLTIQIYPLEDGLGPYKESTISIKRLRYGYSLERN